MSTQVHSCRIAAVIPTYNRRRTLEMCLLALLRQTRPVDEVFIVDNASTDGTQEMIRDKFSQKVTLIRLDDNTGSAGGFYEGIRAAYVKQHDWVWTIDNDAEPLPDALEELIRSPCFSSGRVGLLGSLIIGRDGTVQYFHSIQFSPLMREISTERDDSGRPVRLDAKSYTGALIHRRAIEAIGLPRREYFVYQDDLDYTYRMSRRFEMFLVPRSRVIHEADCRLLDKSLWRVHSRRWLFEDRWQVYYTVRNRIYFLTRNARHYVVPLIVMTMVLDLTRKLAGVLIFDERKYYRAHLILRAARDGFAGRLGKAAWL